MLFLIFALQLFFLLISFRIESQFLVPSYKSIQNIRNEDTFQYVPYVQIKVGIRDVSFNFVIINYSIDKTAALMLAQIQVFVPV
jgi:hypothetical protein